MIGILFNRESDDVKAHDLNCTFNSSSQVTRGMGEEKKRSATSERPFSLNPTQRNSQTGNYTARKHA
jgi:hypothetical protein